MRIFKRNETKPSALQPLIDEIIEEMKGHDATTEEYQKLASSLRMILEAKALEPKPREIDPNTLAVVAGNLAGIGMILLFEMKHVITSRGMPFVQKPRI